MVTLDRKPPSITELNQQNIMAEEKGDDGGVRRLSLNPMVSVEDQLRSLERLPLGQNKPLSSHGVTSMGKSDAERGEAITKRT